MNAYELADDVLDINKLVTRQTVASALRQQADRIAELEKKLQESAMNCISAYAQADDHYARVQELEKQSEPIGKVIYSPLEGYKAWWFDEKPKEGELLYTTPPTHQLSDEEIMDYVEAFSMDMGNVYEFQPENVLQMVRAIESKVLNLTTKEK